jgi:glyoxylase-like metal-dependent hydrolase (beta-lactamase superfamily II)
LREDERNESICPRAAFRGDSVNSTIQLGDITIHRIVEQDTPLFDTMPFFPTLTKELLDENRHWLEPRFIDPASGKLVLCIQSYLIQTPHHNILIDSCVGNHKPRPRPFWHMMNGERYEREFAATGLTLNDIDYVMCTHLHTDHVGWNTRLENGRWVPTFPNAKYLFADRELAYWTQREKENPEAFPHVADSVLPIVAAKRAEIVTSSHAFDEQVQFIPTPGHTVDHFSVHLRAGGHEAVITGDMIHSPLQARYPEMGMMADFDSKQAGETRRHLFGRFCDTPALMCTAHFPSPSTGRIARWGDGFRFVD